MELSFAKVNGDATVVSEKVHFHEIAVMPEGVVRLEKPGPAAGSPYLLHKSRPGQGLRLKESGFMRWFFGTLLALLIAVAIYVGSAVVSLGGLVEAARAGDGAGVLARTDMARLRHSLVDQIVVAYLRQMGRDRPVKPLERMLANTYGATVADAMIAKMLTEENLTRILNSGAIGSDGTAIVNMQRLSAINTAGIFQMLGRISPVKPVEFLVRLGDTESTGGVSIHFEGNGWKLSGIQLPTEAVQMLAQSLIDGRARKG
jgi:hypothetical protein